MRVLSQVAQVLLASRRTTRGVDLGWEILNVDKLTYAGNLNSLEPVEHRRITLPKGRHLRHGGHEKSLRRV